MSTIGLKAHFDGTAIRLDEPYELPTDAQLLVIVLSPSRNDEERESAAVLATEGLSRAYGDDEPSYTVADLIP